MGNSTNTVIIIIIIIIVLALLGGMGYLIYYEYKKNQNTTTTPANPPANQPANPPANQPANQPANPPSLFTQGRNQCQPYSTISGVEIPNFDIPNGHYNNQSQTQCQELCNKNHCNWFTFDNSTNECWLKQGKKDINYTTGFRVPNGTNSLKCPNYSMFQNTNVDGFDMLNGKFKNISIPDCVQKCNVNKCDWFVHEKSSGDCLLKKGTPSVNKLTIFKMA